MVMIVTLNLGFNKIQHLEMDFFCLFLHRSWN